LLGFFSSKEASDGLLSMYSKSLTTAFILLYVSAKILNVNDKIALICKLQTRDNPIKFVLSVPMLAMVVMTPKYPAAAMVTIENISVTKLIHLVVMF